MKLNRKGPSKVRYLKIIMETRLNVMLLITIAIFVCILLRLVFIQIVNHNFYQTRVGIATLREVTGPSSPRGRIYDRNHNLLVDNVAVKAITYQRPRGDSRLDQIEAAHRLLEIVDIDVSNATNNQLINYWIITNPDKAKNLITDEEQQSFAERRLTRTDITALQRKRVTAEMLSELTKESRKAALVFFLMNNGFDHELKTIKDVDVTDVEFMNVMSRAKDGFSTKMTWERVYLHGDTFRTMLGRVSNSSSGIPYELKDYYLNKGYELNDKVGISNLELQYENILRGTKPIYSLDRDNNRTLVKPGSRGQDIVLSIDIELQKEVERILTNEVIATRREPNTRHFNRAFVIVAEPSTGEILAMSGKKYQNGQIIDYTPGITTLPVTAGSVVKGASSIVAYNAGVINVGGRMRDECLHIRDTPPKCSWRQLGYVDDIEAMAVSSNVFQFHNAIRVGGGTYRTGEGIRLNPDAFITYRNTYMQFGLGVRTNIDLPVESIGFRGTSTLPGHLLDFSIGQYDTYTPIQISSYINTVANRGTRVRPSLLRAIYDSNTEKPLQNLVFEHSPVIVNRVQTEPRYLERVIRGFIETVRPGGRGTGPGVMGNAPNPAGKTGTSQSFIDTTGDGRVDTETISTSFVGFAPADNPVMSITVVSPDVKTGPSGAHQSTITRRITTQVTNIFFQNR